MKRNLAQAVEMMDGTEITSHGLIYFQIYHLLVRWHDGQPVAHPHFYKRGKFTKLIKEVVVPDRLWKFLIPLSQATEDCAIENPDLLSFLRKEFFSDA